MTEIMPTDRENGVKALPLSPRSPSKAQRQREIETKCTNGHDTNVTVPAKTPRVLLNTPSGKRVALVYCADRTQTKTLADVRALLLDQLGEELSANIRFEVSGAPLALSQERFEPFGDDTRELVICELPAPSKGKRDGANAAKEAKEVKQAKEPKECPDKESDGEKKGYFKVERKTVDCTDCAGKPTGETEEVVTVTVIDSPLRESLRRATSLPIFYEPQPSVKTTQLLPYLKQFEASDATKQMRSLGAFLATEFAAVKAKLDGMIQKGNISFDCLWYLFGNGAKFVTSIDGCDVGSVVEQQRYERCIFSNDFVVTASFVRSNGRVIAMTKRSFNISAYPGAMPIAELPIRPISPAEIEALAERGKIFRAHAIGAHYAHYAGSGFRKTWYCKTFTRADGRVVIDGANFARFNPNYNLGVRGGDEESGGETSIDDEMLWRCWHTLCGFSLTAKKWLELKVDGLSAVKFDDDAYDRLVLSSERKELVRALVTQQGPKGRQFADVIAGKGGGCIFLLHGSPGTGKTLTAEAIAELLHRPLYSVGVGELGTSCTELEERLREILEVASAWNAVVLIDEADIFLERRSENDIARNAMVGVFLRLLEYHQGVLFLTTNRVRSFDEAFHSRISVALRYEPLGEAARAEVWANLLDAARVGGLEPDQLAKYELNGRMIKNTIRLAQSLAAAEGVSVSSAHVARTVGVTNQFQADLSADGLGLGPSAPALG